MFVIIEAPAVAGSRLTTGLPETGTAAPATGLTYAWSVPSRMTAQRLLLDAMLGKLARYLRMCGYDAEYVLDRDVEADETIHATAREEDRTLLTRDRSLAAGLEDSLLLTSRDIEDQLRELAAAGYELTLAETPGHCGQCNGRLREVAPDLDTPAHVPDPTETTVWQCEECGQYFWKGSHWDDVAETLSDL